MLIIRRENMEYWEYDCPVCEKHVKTGHTLDTIANAVGFTYDCNECGHTIQIEENYAVSDFGKALVESYRDYGISVSREEAESSYM